MKRSEALQACPGVYDYLSKILKSEELQESVYEICFEVAAEWVIKTDVFLSHDGLVDIVFQAARSKYFSKAKKILINAITNSNNCRGFLEAKFEQAFKNISDREQKFLDSVVELLIEGVENFQNNLSELEDEFSDDYSDLTNELLTNFQILFFQDLEKAQKLFQIVYLLIQHCERKISIRGIEIMGSLKETIYEIESDLKKAGDTNYLITAFFEAMKITLVRCKRPLYALNEDGTLVDPDSDDEEDIHELR